MTTEPQTNLSRRSLWRRRITYTSAQKKSIMQNKPNIMRFYAKNSLLREKQTQFKANPNPIKPNQTQFFASFILPILPYYYNPTLILFQISTNKHLYLPLNHVK